MITRMDQQLGLWFQALSRQFVLLSQTHFSVPHPPNPNKHLVFTFWKNSTIVSHINATETLDKLRE